MSVESFFDRLSFEPDAFQMEAARAVVDGKSVVVTAPTGAGKTLVAEAAIHHFTEIGRRAFYTTPLKALSNQKFRDLTAVYGTEHVGLLTGDNTINGDASIVVMTTEVLRNMLYAGSDVSEVGVVVLDEVHYLQDRFRGAVWEEVIIHAPPHIQLVALSATVANPGEFTDWIRERRGPAELVIEETRPVPLEAWWAVKDLAEDDLPVLPMFTETKKGTVPNPAIPRLLSRQRGRRRRFVTPRRLEIVDELGPRSMLPAIYFVFSRAGCDDAARAVVSAGVRMTTEDERSEIRRRAEAGTAHLAEEDLGVLDYGSWLTNLEAGVAAHHAGLVPAFKEVVEDLFSSGLVKLVFATETLALGINMPARTVVLDKLTKYSGEGHEMLLPGEFTQLTGRAGRRGIDTIGHGVVLFSPYVPFERVTAVAQAGSHPMRSSFRPTYNMVVNLIANYERDRAEELLKASFAQFQNDRSLSRLAAAIRKNERRLERAIAAAEDGPGDVWAHIDQPPVGASKAATRAAEGLSVGDVIDIPIGNRSGRFVVIRRRPRSSGVMLEVVRSDGERSRIRARDVPGATHVVGRVDLPSPFPPPRDALIDFVATLEEIDSEGARPLVESHVASKVPIGGERLSAARKARRLRRELERQRDRQTDERSGLIGELNRTLDLLGEWGYQKEWILTERGEALRVVYGDLDLLFTEAIARGLLADLDGAELSAMVSIFVYESRFDDDHQIWPTEALHDRFDETVDLWGWLTEAERSHGLARSRQPDPGFVAIAYWWAKGTDLDSLLGDDDIAAGDFVRSARQTLDALRQLRDAASVLGDDALVASARQGLSLVDRGVVSAGGAS